MRGISIFRIHVWICMCVDCHVYLEIFMDVCMYVSAKGVGWHVWMLGTCALPCALACMKNFFVVVASRTTLYPTAAVPSLPPSADHAWQMFMPLNDYFFKRNHRVKIRRRPGEQFVCQVILNPLSCFSCTRHSLFCFFSSPPSHFDLLSSCLLFLLDYSSITLAILFLISSNERGRKI